MVDTTKENYKRLKKVNFYKRILDRLAYLSLVADVGIAVATLISLKLYSSNIGIILKWLEYALSGIVAVTIFVFVLFAFESNYHKKIVSTTARLARMSLGKRGR